MMRSQTDEQLAARWDPEPWLHEQNPVHDQTGKYLFTPDPERRADGGLDNAILAPRPECIPSRWRTEVTSDGYGPNGYPRVLIPRPPVNPILVAFRGYMSGERWDGDTVEAAIRWLSVLDGDDTESGAANLIDEVFERLQGGVASAQVDFHARKVLTRLAALA